MFMYISLLSKTNFLRKRGRGEEGEIQIHILVYCRVSFYCYSLCYLSTSSIVVVVVVSSSLFRFEVVLVLVVLSLSLYEFVEGEEGEVMEGVVLFVGVAVAGEREREGEGDRDLSWLGLLLALFAAECETSSNPIYKRGGKERREGEKKKVRRARCPSTKHHARTSNYSLSAVPLLCSSQQTHNEPSSFDKTIMSLCYTSFAGSFAGLLLDIVQARSPI